MDGMVLLPLIEGLVVLFCLKELYLGGSSTMYYAECHLSGESQPVQHVSLSQLLGSLLPLQLGALGLPLLVYAPFLGASLLVAALVLFLGRERLPRTASLTHHEYGRR